MSPSAVVYESPISGERYELEVPLESTRDLRGMRADLGLADFVDVQDSQVARAIGLLWAAKHAPQLSREHPSLSRFGEPVALAVFGGVAIRMLCRCANEAGPFRRQLGDVDLVTTRAEGPRAVQLLTSLAGPMGSRYWHAATKSDQVFNALRRGRRYRLHAAEEHDDGSVGSCVLDLLTDEIAFCHTIPIGHAIACAAEHAHTIGGTDVMLSKLQAIRAVDPAAVTDEHRYRVIGELGAQVLIGPEDKDLLDVAALLAEHGIGRRPGQIDPEAVGGLLRSDWGLHRTVRMNVANPGMYVRALRKRGAPPDTIALVEARLDELLAVIDDPSHQPRKPRLRLGRTWWDVVEDHEHD